MKTKKNLSKIIGLVMLLVVCIGALVIWVQYTVNQNVVSCYIAKTDVEPYTTIDNSNFLEYFEEGTIHKTSYEKLKNPITSKDQIIGYETTSIIVSGYPLDASLFQKKANSVYGDIKVPVKVTLPIEADKVDTSILNKGKIVTIIGYMNSTSSVTNDNGENVDNDSWVGILTNNAIVYSVNKDKNNAIQNATFVIESSVYSSVVMMAENYSVYFLEGSLNDIADAKSDIVKNLYNQSGTTASQSFTITNTELSFDKKRVISNIPTYFATGTDTNYYDGTGVKQKLSYFSLDGTNGLDLTWSGSTASVFVYHYATDGSRGERYGLYSKTANDTYSNSLTEEEQEKYMLSYDPIANETKFVVPLANVGFYQVIFDIKNPKYGQKYITSQGIETDEPFYIHYAINFIIENNASDYTTNSKLIIDTLNSNKLVYEISNTRDYFENIALMKQYTENKDITTNVAKREIVYSTGGSNFHVIPLFNKNTKQTTGLTPTDEQKTTLVELFGADILTDTVFDSIFKTKVGESSYFLYDKYEMQNIIDTLKNSTYLIGEFSEFTKDEKYIVLYSLGFNISTDDDINSIITNVLTPKTNADNSTTPVSYKIYYKTETTPTIISIEVNK